MKLIQVSDAAVASGQAFLNGELEKRKTTINMPLSQHTWQRDVMWDMGGGALEWVSNMFVDLAASGPNEDGIVAGATSVIPLIQANFNKDNTPVFPWMNNLMIKFLDLQKMMNTGRSIDGVLQTGLQTNWNKTLDKNLYTGFTSVGTTGLLNNTSVTAASVIASALNPNAVSGAALKLWINKTPDEILNDINTFITAQWAAVEYTDANIMNQINLPPAKFAYLVGTKNSNAGNISLLSYIEQNNIATKQGVDLKFVPCRQCIGAGAGGVDRMVGYSNRKNHITFDITVPLAKGMTTFDKDMAYYTNYFAFFSSLQILYYQTIRYADGF